LVDVPPSTSRRLNVASTAWRSDAWASAGTASVVSTASMVAMFGAHMPAPLAKPPTAQPS
jgi:hypothetical protein